MPFPSRKRRRPKPGTEFLLVRLIGWFFTIIGGLLILAALLGFLVMLVKIGPTIVDALQFPEQKMAGFVILIVSGGLLLFVLLGLAGAISLGLGFAFSRWGTETVVVSTVTETTEGSLANL